MRQAKRLLAMACVLLAGTVLGEDNAVQQNELEELRLKYYFSHEQGIEQLLSASVYDPSQLPPSGELVSEYTTFLQHTLKQRNGFKFITWGLCVSPRSEKEGTVLVIESAQRRRLEDNHFAIEVTYRPVMTPNPHAEHEVWPYTLFVVKGWSNELVCREAQNPPSK